MKTAADLDKLFAESEQVDKREFAKMRSSLKLIAGEHYHRDSSGFNYIRSSKELAGDTKLRLTKNHVGRIARRYANHIATAVPGVAVKPKHERELQDQKSAELNQSIWVDFKETNDFKSVVNEFIDDFGNIGEVVGKIFFDTNKRKVGIESIFAFNLLRCPSAKNIKQSPYYVVRKMAQVKDTQAAFPEHAEKIKESNDETFLVFQEGEYRMNTKTEIMIREFYFKPCAEYPRGYYFIQIPGLILDEGELPGGIFPICVERFEYIQTKCRGISLTEPLRPYQLEVNRTASKIAEHQITLGDDKLILQNGAKLSAGVQLPGIRGITVSGPAPVVMEGRSGSQYVEYMLGQIKEMYSVAEISEDDELQSNLDPHTLLYRAASEKRRFSRYVMRFESFLKDICTKTLEMAKFYYSEDDVVMAVGRNERVNIAEFKKSEPSTVQIVVEPQSEDVESKLGRQLVMTNILQYVGSALDQASIGKLIKELPYANVGESFSDLTLDFEMATNLILALDRGEMPQMFPFEKHEYIISKLSKRMSEADFKFLHPFIQDNYQIQIKQRMEIMQQQKEALLREQSGFIPDGGALIGVDYYVTDANNPERTRRARIPYASVDWLVRKLEEQGTFKQAAMQIPEAVLAEGALSDIPQAQGANAEIVKPDVAGLVPGMG